MRFLRPHPWLAALLLGLVVLAAHAQSRKPPLSETPLLTKATTPQGYKVGPAPEWTTALPHTSATGSGAVFYRLVDTQVRVGHREQERYIHIVKVVNSASGLSAGGSVQVQFNPAYEALTLHHVDIVRAGQRIPVLASTKVNLLQRETRLEQQMYDGRITAVLGIDDLRAGDAVDYAYTVTGSNPAMGGKYVDEVWMLGGDGPASQIRFRLLAPAGRTIHYKPSTRTEVDSRALGQEVETVFLRKNAPQWQGDDTTPYSYYRQDKVRLSEFSSWQEVAAWGHTLFEGAADHDSVALKEVIRAIQEQDPAAEAQVQRALDFVQKEIRYFGTEVGPYSHQPARVSKVLAQRYGDCKDKSALLIAILRGLNIPAWPVLASLSDRDKLDDSFPSPYAFDHAITLVQVQDKRYWLDGTRGFQTGPVPTRNALGMGKTLVLQQDTQQLSTVPSAHALARMQVEDVIEVKSWKEVPQLTSTTTYFGEAAERFRSIMATETTERAQFDFSAELARAFPTLVANSDLQVSEVPHDNAVQVIQRFTLPKYWRMHERRAMVGNYSLWGLISPVRYAHEVNRTRPYLTSVPGVYRHTIRFRAPESLYTKVPPRNWRDSGKNHDFEVNVAPEGNAMTVEGTLRIKEQNVAPHEWGTYTEFLRKQEPMLSGNIVVPSLPPADAAQLRQQILDLTDSWSGFFGRSKPKTRVQADARVDVLLYTAQLRAGRLSSEAKAEVLHRRGSALDHLGRYQEARSDFDAALALTPQDAELELDASINAIALGDPVRAMKHVEQAMALDPTNKAPLRRKALLLYRAGDYAQAKQALKATLQDGTDASGGFALLELALITLNLKESPRVELAAYADSLDKTTWPYPLLKPLLSQGNWDAAFDAAEKGAKDESNLCGAYYYAAEYYLALGDKTQAKKYFKKVLETGVVEYVEHMLAQHRLAQL